MKDQQKEIKPVNITKNDENYRNFLKKLVKIKPRREFLRNGLTLRELEEILSHFYTSLSSARKSEALRLAGYNVWVRNNRSRIYEDIKKMKKNPTKVLAPNNALKAETFENFVDVIRKFKKKDRLENVMENHEKIAKKLFGETAKKKLAYVKQYIKMNFNDLKKNIDNLSEIDSEVEEDDSISVNSDESDTSSNSNNDEGIFEIDKRFQRMDTDDSSSHSSSVSKKIFEGFSKAGKSTPKSVEKRSKISLDNNDSMDTDTVPQTANKSVSNHKDLVEAAKSEILHDSGVVLNASNRTSTDVTEAISSRNAAQGDGDAENQRYTNLILQDALVEEWNEYAHLPTALQVDAALSTSVSPGSYRDDTCNKSSFGKSSEKASTTSKRSIASVEDENNLISITEKSAANADHNQINSSAWISMSNVEYSPIVNIPERSRSDDNCTSARSKKRFKTRSTNELAALSTSSETNCVSIRNMEISFDKLPNNVNYEHDSVLSQTNTGSSTSSKYHGSASSSANCSTSGLLGTNLISSDGDFQSININTTWNSHKNFDSSSPKIPGSKRNDDTWNSHKHFDSSSPKIPGPKSNDDTWNSHKHFDSSSPRIRGDTNNSERSESFKTALTRIDANSVTKPKKSSPSSDHNASIRKSHDFENDVFVSADECCNALSKENSGSSYNENSE